MVTHGKFDARCAVLFYINIQLLFSFKVTLYRTDTGGTYSKQCRCTVAAHKACFFHFRSLSIMIDMKRKTLDTGIIFVISNIDPTTIIKTNLSPPTQELVIPNTHLPCVPLGTS